MYHQYERQSEYSTILKVILDAKKINMQTIRKKKLFYGGHISMVESSNYHTTLNTGQNETP